MAVPGKWKPNPYIIGRPVYEPELFFGREKLFEFVANALGEGARALSVRGESRLSHASESARVILLCGQRRIGKTTVLHHLPRFVRLPDFAFVFFDLQAQGNAPLAETLHSLAATIVENLALDLGRRVELPSLEALERDVEVFTDEFLTEVFGALDGKRLVLLLDEFDVLNDPVREEEIEHRFFSFLKAALAQQPKLFLLAVVGRQLDEIERLQSLFKGAPYQEIELLDKPGTARLIEQPVRGLLTYDGAAIQMIYDLSAGHPYCTQLLCHAVFTRLQMAGGSGIAGAEDVEAVVDDAMENGHAGLVWFRNGLEPPERVIFSAVAAVRPGGGSKAAAETVWTLLERHGVERTERLVQAEKQLVAWNYLRESERAKAPAYPYEINVELVRRWLLKRYPVKEAVKELEMIDEKANLFYQQSLKAEQGGERLKARALYQLALELNPNHLSALFRMAEINLGEEQFEAAEALYRRAYRIDSLRARDGWVKALVGWGRSLVQQGEFDLAYQHFRQVAELEPHDRRWSALLAEVETQRQRALAVRNPFVIGQPVRPEQFAGREREARMILSQVLQGGHVWVCGERGIGKTSLLRYLASPTAWHKYDADLSRAFVVAVNCQMLTPFTPARFWEDVLEELREQAEKQSEDQPEETKEILNLIGGLPLPDLAPPRAWRKLWKTLREQSRRLILLIDEFDVVFQTRAGYADEDVKAFLQELRSQATSREFASVVAARRNPTEISSRLQNTHASEFFNHYLSLLLKPLDRNDVSELVRQAPETFRLKGGESEWLWEVAGGHPYVLQIALSLLFQNHVAGLEFAPGPLTKELIDLTNSFFATLWSELSEEEKALLTLITLKDLEERIEQRPYKLSDLDINVSRPARKMGDLRSRGLIVERDMRLGLFSLPLELWILKEVESQPEVELTRLLEQCDQVLSRRQTDQLREALEQVREQKPVFPAAKH